MLDLSAAFDTVHHDLLMDRLQEIGVYGSAWKLLKSFLTNRSQLVALGDFTSEPFALPCGVPQGSSLSPTLFNVYVSSLAPLIQSFGFSLTSYADDTQIVVAVQPNKWCDTAGCFKDSMNAVGTWMAQNCLKLNSGKTEVLCFGNDPTFWTPEWWPDTLGPLPLPRSKVKNLGVWVDQKLSFKDQVNSEATSFALKSCKKILPFLPKECHQTVITAFTMSRLDYCNSLFLNIQEGLMHKLQRLQNAAIRLVTGISKYASVSSELRYVMLF